MVKLRRNPKDKYIKNKKEKYVLGDVRWDEIIKEGSMLPV